MPEAVPARRFAYHALVGTSEEEARLVLLEMFARDAACRVFGRLRRDAAPFGPVTVYFVVDDGFDDACDYTPTFSIFRQDDLRPPPGEERDPEAWLTELWTALDAPIARAPMSMRDWATWVSFQGEALGGAGVCAIVGRAVLQVTLSPAEGEGAGRSWTRPEVSFTEVEWSCGPEWGVERLSEEGDDRFADGSDRSE